ncbi:MAG: M56 family metallopeptidase [Pirellulales bacterium]
MNRMIESLNAWSEAWLPYVFHAGWQGALVGAALLAVVLLGRRWPSPLKHALLVVALLKFVVPPFATSPTGVLSYIAIGRNAPTVMWSDSLPVRQTETTEDNVQLASSDIRPWDRAVSSNDGEDPINHASVRFVEAQVHEVPHGLGADPRKADSAAATLALSTRETDRDRPLGGPAYLMLVHFAGSVLFCSVLIWQSVNLHRLLRRGTKIKEGSLYRRYSDIARRVGVRRIPVLLAVAKSESPFSCGVWRRAIVLPKRLLDSASGEELDLVLAHELAHHRRRDLTVNWLQAAVHVLWWFHPVVWFLNRQLRSVREDCCDDLLLAEGLADGNVYCDSLLRVAAASRGSIMPSLALRMSCQRTGLARRFRRLMDASLLRAARLSRRSFVLTLLIAIALLPGLSESDQSAEADEAQSKLSDTDTKQQDSKTSPNKSQQRDQDAGGDSQSTADSSRAWYLLSQDDTAGLLNGLPQRLIQANSKERRSTPVWQGVDNGAELKIRIETEGKVAGEVLVGFFKESNWEAAEPAQVRSFPGAGEYTVERLIPGKYWVGAIVGTVDDFTKSAYSLGKGAGMGVEKHWPKPLELQEGQASNAHIRVSDKYRLTAMNDEQFRGHFGLWGPMKPEQLVTIKTVDSAGEPVPYCSVTLNQLVKGDDTRIDRFHGFGTDANGVAYCDAFLGRFTVTVQKVDLIPELFAVRFRVRQFPTVYQVPLPFMIDVPIDPVPDGSATLSGRVHDQFGKPLREFYLTLDRDQKRGPFDWDSFSITMPFTSDDGIYSVPDLPPGTYTARIRHFDYATHVYRTGYKERTVTIPIEPNGRVHADFEVEAKELLYGRAVFDDGKPATKGLWVASFGGQQGNNFAMNIEEDSRFRVTLSAEETRKVNKYFGGTVQVWAYVGDQERSRVDVPLRKLSRDANKPAIVVLPTKPAADEPNPPAEGDDGPAPDAMAWISDLKVLGGEERTLQLSDFMGKPIMLNLFGPWCQECIEKMPELVELHDQYADKGVVMLAICKDVDTREVEAYLKKHELPFPIACDVDGYAVDFFRRGRSEPAYPTNVVLDGQGKRLLRQVGFAGENLKNLHTAIQQALKTSQ